MLLFTWVIIYGGIMVTINEMYAKHGKDKIDCLLDIMNETPKHELIEDLLGLTDMEDIDSWVKDYDEQDFSWMWKEEE
jgi:uncharacterized protein YjgD (DUF1641 family)